MGNLDLSVIIPNYNKINYLERCILSVIAQSMQPKEIIVVDDCSTDGSDAFLKDMAKEYSIIHPIFLKQNGGVSNARNVGLQNAKSSFVTFMDSDDFYFNKQKLENEMAIIYASTDPKHCISYSRVVLVDQDGQFINGRYNRKWSKREFPRGVVPLKMLGLLYQRRIPRDYCVSKAFLEEVGSYCYPENYFEDLDLVMRLALGSGFFCCTYMEGTAYRQTNNGLSKRKKDPHIDPVLTIADSYASKRSIKEIRVIRRYRVIASFIKIKNLICDRSFRLFRRIVNR